MMFDTHSPSKWKEQVGDHQNVRLHFPIINQLLNQQDRVFTFGLIWVWACDDCRNSWPYGYTDKQNIIETPCQFIDKGVGI